MAGVRKAGRSNVGGNKRSKKNSKGASSSRHTQEEQPNWGTHTRLSMVKLEWQPVLYLEKMKKKKYWCERVAQVSDWKPFGIYDIFRRWGWLMALNPTPLKIWIETDLIYPKFVLEWMSTLVRDVGDNPAYPTTLTGTVGGISVELSMKTFNDIVRENLWDNAKEVEYEYPSKMYLFDCGPTHEKWYPMIEDLFQFEGDVKKYILQREDLYPLPKVLSYFINFNILPRTSDMLAIRNYEVPLLHALVTGSPVLSLPHVMMLNLWESRDQKARAVGNTIYEILVRHVSQSRCNSRKN